MLLFFRFIFTFGSGGMPGKVSNQRTYEGRSKYVQCSHSLIKFLCLFKNRWSCILNAVGEQATPVGSQSAGTAEDGHQHPGFDYVGCQSVMRGIFKNVFALLFAFFLLKFVTMRVYFFFKETISSVLEMEQNITSRV